MARHTLTDQTRQTFCRLRGLTAWNDDDTRWEEQGSEQAAEIIAWALFDQELALGKIRDAHRWLAQAYLQLTGTIPLLRVAAVLDRHHVYAWTSDRATVVEPTNAWVPSGVTPPQPRQANRVLRRPRASRRSSSELRKTKEWRGFRCGR